MISKIVVAGPAPLRRGGLGLAAAEFVDGARGLGRGVEYIGPQSAGPATRLATGRVFRRAFGKGASRSLGARAVRRAVPATGWDLVYAIGGSVPVELTEGIKVIHQSTRHPRIEFSAVKRAERETGGRGASSRLELRRREYEIGHADLIHVTSRGVRDEFLAAGVSIDRIVEAPLGVDIDRFKPGSKSGPLRIAFVGVLSMQKGVDIAANLATRMRGTASVETVGGPSCPWSRRIVEAAPFAQRESVAEMLADAHLLIHPSRADGFGYVVLEALASGAVPIVTPEVGASEIVARLDRRLVIPRHEFCERVPTLVEELNLPALSVQARSLAKEFDHQRTSQAIVTAVLERAEELQP